MNSSFLFNCRDCEFCFGATDQRNKKYILFNEQLTKEEWERRVAEIDLRSFQIRTEYEKRFRDLMSKAVWPENFNIHQENATGEYMINCIDVRDGYNLANGCRNLDHVTYATSASHDAYLVSGMTNSSDGYYSIGLGDTMNGKFICGVISRCLDMEYCNSCYDCENCFGCSGLRHKKFCILNKQYTEEEYWQMLDVLKCTMLEKGEYGDMPSMKFAIQPWSGSGAVAIFDATKEECLKLGAVDFSVSDQDAQGPAVDPETIKSLDLMPDRIDDGNDIAGVMFMDPELGRRFAYRKDELAIYDKLGVAPPRRHPVGRMRDLFNELNIAVSENQPCAKCGKEIRVARNRAYPNRIVYCTACYLKYIETK